jgi:hypothetical protein
VKIYIDTNWFLSFYQSSHERQSVLEKLAEHSELIVMTDQNATEFRRNRSAVLHMQRNAVEKSTAVRPYTTSLLLGLAEHAEVVRATRELATATRVLLDKLDNIEQSTLDDLVSITFNELLSRCTVIPVTDEDVSRAQIRKARGIPPSTSKRDTIGDEIIWECLLRGCEEDLAVVSLDSDFLSHRSLLVSEFGAHPSRRRLVHVGDRLADALTKFGSLTPEEYKHAYRRDPMTRCGNCGAESWHYAGRDRNHAHEERARVAMGYEPRSPEDLAASREFEKHVYVCGECNSLMFLT